MGVVRSGGGGGGFGGCWGGLSLVGLEYAWGVILSSLKKFSISLNEIISLRKFLSATINSLELHR